MATGILIVRTRAGRGAVPVVGAVVNIFASDSDSPVASVRTDLSGSTDEIPLPAPDRGDMSNSLSPPFTNYRVDIDHPDYRPVTVRGVSVFSDITTVLPVSMVPPRSLEELNKRIIIDSTETGPTGSSPIGSEVNNA